MTSIVVGALILLAPLACSQVKFDGIEVECQGSGRACVTEKGFDEFNYPITIESEKADVLFVIDNSASMSPIQDAIGNRFVTFFRSLQRYDVHIGMITTDISSASNPARAINDNGALQDGRLVSFETGTPFIKTKSTSNAETLFLNAISRTIGSKTKQCENYINQYCTNGGCTDKSAYATNCPSSDTSGIHASNLTAANDVSGFLRENVPFSVIIVSNADERNMGGTWADYPLLAPNKPETLVSTINKRFEGTKSLTAHSIIIPPGNTTCYNAHKYTDYIFGYYGKTYKTLSDLTKGTTGSICSTDYSKELGAIATTIVERLESHQLACEPVNGEIKATISPNQSVTYTLNGTELKFVPALNPGTTVQLSFKCLKK